VRCAILRLAVNFNPVVPVLTLVFMFKSCFRQQQCAWTEFIKPETTPTELPLQHQLDPAPGFLPASLGQRVNDFPLVVRRDG
jgi:hypothetical protein